MIESGDQIVMGKTELILICLLAVAFLAIAARRWQLPFPILLTLGGVVLALMPGLPKIQLEPDLVFDLFLSGRMRLQALPVWEMVLFALNGILFMLIGLQLPDVIRSKPAGSPLGFAKLRRLARGDSSTAAGSPMQPT